MLGYLKQYNITDNDIDNILKKYDDNIIKALEYSKTNVIDIIKCLKEYKVNDIKNVVLNRIDLLFMSVSTLKQNFTKLDKNMISFIINNSIDDLINFNI